MAAVDMAVSSPRTGSRDTSSLAMDHLDRAMEDQVTRSLLMVEVIRLKAMEDLVMVVQAMVLDRDMDMDISSRPLPNILDSVDSVVRRWDWAVG